jgi:hypothetical protein
MPPEKKFDSKSSFRRPGEEAPRSFWGTLWGTYWFELFILLLFALAIAGLLLPLLEDELALDWEYLKSVIRYIIRPIFIGVDSIISILFLIALVKGWPLRPPISLFQKATVHGGRGGKKHVVDKELVAHWARITVKAATKTTENLRLAFIEADTIVDLFLRKAGYIGDTMADRLKNITQGDAPSLPGVWEAHRLRNDVVHTPGFTLRPQDAERGIEAFESFLKELGALE